MISRTSESSSELRRARSAGGSPLAAPVVARAAVRRTLAWALLGCVALTSAGALAGTGVKPLGAQATEASAEPPLRPMPQAPSRKLRPATDEERRVLDELLTRLLAGANTERRMNPSDILDVDASLVPAIRERLDAEARGADRAAMKALLLDTRKGALKQADGEEKGEGDAARDYLTMLLAAPKPSSEHWQRLVRVLALSRMCGRVATIEAVRSLIHVYVRFEFLRIDTQLQLKTLGDRGLPGLIEATQHAAPEVASWARRRLDFLGKAIPSEAIAVSSPEILADVIRAYGYNRDLDAVRVVVSFANSERFLVREAARQAVSLYGESANWQLRDAYEQVTGERPARDWSWERTARELFRQFDRSRLTDVYQYYDEGRKAQERGDLVAMRQAFDRVVLRSPNFEQGQQLAVGYLAFAQKYAAEDPGAAGTALLRAERLTTDPELRAKAESLRLTLRAEALAAQAVADQSLLRTALEVDPNNARAAKLLSDLEAEPLSETTGFFRTLWPFILGFLSLLFPAIIVLRKLRAADRAV